MKIIKMNTAERLVAIAICNMQDNRVGVEYLKEFYDQAAKFGLTDEEKTAIGWSENKDDKGEITGYTWNDKGVEGKDIEFTDFMHKFFIDKFPKLEYAPIDPLALAANSLWEKLKA